MNKVVKAISYLTVFASLISIIIFWGTMVYPYEPVELLSPIEVTNVPLKVGEPANIHMSFVKKMDITPEIKYFLVDSVVYQFSQGGIRRTIGANDVYVQKDLPANIPPGKYYVQIELSYQVLPWRTINYVWKSNEFQIYK